MPSFANFERRYVRAADRLGLDWKLEVIIGLFPTRQCGVGRFKSTPASCLFPPPPCQDAKQNVNRDVKKHVNKNISQQKCKWKRQ